MKTCALLTLIGGLFLLTACPKPAQEFPVFYNGTATPAEIVFPGTSLHTPPILGRNLIPDDFRPEAEPVAMISYDFWVEATGQSAQVIGTKIKFSNLQFIVVGVLPKTTSGGAGRKVLVSKRG